MESLNLNTGHVCNLCNTKQAVARVYGQSQVSYEQKSIPGGAIYFCGECGKILAHRIIDYSTEVKK